MGADSARGAGVLELDDVEGFDALVGDCAVVALDLTHTVADVVAQHGVRAEAVEVHVAAHANELRAGEVIKRDVIFEDFADADEVLAGGGLAGSADLVGGVSGERRSGVW